MIAMMFAKVFLRKIFYACISEWQDVKFCLRANTSKRSIIGAKYIAF